MNDSAQVTVAIYEDLMLELGDRVLGNLSVAALEAAEARRLLQEPTGRDHAMDAIDRVTGEIASADRDLRNSLATIALGRTESHQA